MTLPGVTRENVERAIVALEGIVKAANRMVELMELHPHIAPALAAHARTQVDPTKSTADQDIRLFQKQRQRLAANGAECGCSLHSRCNQHELTRPKACRCNGPLFASSSCPLATHRSDAAAWPELDPAQVE